MKKIILFTAIIMGFAAASLVTGCRKTPVDNPIDRVPEFTLAPTEFNDVSWEGATVKLTITTDTDWEIINIPAWVTAATTTGKGTAQVDITVLPNEGDSRNATMKVTAGESVKSFTISQQALVRTPSLTILTNEFHGVRKAGETVTLSIVSTVVEWSIAELPAWCTVAAADMSGTGNKAVSVQVAENTGDNVRTGTFKVNGTGGVATISVTVSQLGSKMFMPDNTLRANEAYYKRIVVVDDVTGEFTLTDKGRDETIVSSYFASSTAGLEHYPNLRQIIITGDAVQDRNLSEVDIRAMRKLEFLIMQSCPKVKIVRANDMPNLKKITISNNPRPEKVAIEELYADGSSNLDTLECSGGKLKTIDVSGAQKLRALYVMGNAPLTEITGVEDCVNMRDLRAYDCNLKSLNVSHAPNLVRLQFRNNDITEIDLSKNKRLEYLSCGANKITELNLAQMENLSMLLVEGNTLLAELDFSGTQLLRELHCQNTALTSIDVNGQSALYYLDCFSMPDLQTLNISGCRNITQLGLTHRASVDAVTHNSFSGSVTGLLDLSPYMSVTPSFKELIADSCPQFKGVICNGNAVVERVSLQSCDKLKTIRFADNGNLRYLNVTGSPVDSYEVEGSHPSFEVVGKN